MTTCKTGMYASRRSPKLDRMVFEPTSAATQDNRRSIGFEDQGFVTEVNQHRMVLEVEPAGEHLEAKIFGPCRFVVEPPRQLLDENVFTQVAQDLVDLGI